MTRNLITAVVLLAALPFSAAAKVLWKGDFETGNISQWTKAQSVASDRLVVQSSHVKQGQYALRAVVKQGDDPINSGGNRNELVDVTYQPEGAERWYHWYTYFSEDYPSAKKWQVFTQWHQYEDFGSPPIEFDVYGEEIHLTNWQQVIWRAPLVRGKWISFLFHVKWSKDPNVGFVELYVDGELALEKRFLKSDSRVYLKQGLYRNSDIAPDGVVYHDGMTVGEERADVEPAWMSDSGETDAGTPESDGGTPDPVDDPGTPTGDPVVDGGTTSPPFDPLGEDPTLYEPNAEALGCSSTGGLAVPFALLFVIGALALRRRQRS